MMSMLINSCIFIFDPMWNMEVLGLKMGLSFQGYWGATTWGYLASVLVCKFISSIDSQMPGLWGDLAYELSVQGWWYIWTRCPTLLWIYIRHHHCSALCSLHLLKWLLCCSFLKALDYSGDEYIANDLWPRFLLSGPFLFLKLWPCPSLSPSYALVFKFPKSLLLCSFTHTNVPTLLTLHFCAHNVGWMIATIVRQYWFAPPTICCRIAMSGSWFVTHLQWKRGAGDCCFFCILSIMFSNSVFLSHVQWTNKYFGSMNAASFLSWVPYSSTSFFYLNEQILLIHECCFFCILSTIFQ